VITASHNPPEYNGYKVYWNTGGQLVPPHDREIIQRYLDIKEYGQIECQSFDLAVKLFEAKNYAQSDRFCTAITHALPDHFQAITISGIIADNAGRPDLAFQRFQRALDIIEGNAIKVPDEGLASLQHNLATTNKQLRMLEQPSAL